METIFMNKENQKKKQTKTNESCKFVLNALQRLALTISNKHTALQNLFK